MIKKYINSLIEENYPIKITQAHLDKYLLKTASLDQDESERLRLLAIALEYEQFRDGWSGFKKIYEKALKHDSENQEALYSYAISGLEWIEEDKTKSFKERVQIAEECINVLMTRTRGDLLDKSRANHILGLLYYNHPLREKEFTKYKERALSHFEKANELDKSSQITKLFIGHCYDDLKNWKEAITWYLEVNPERLLEENKDWKWRIYKLEEQIAFCYLKQGEMMKAKSKIINLFGMLELEDNTLDSVANLEEGVKIVQHLEDESLQNRMNDLLNKFGLMD